MSRLLDLFSGIGTAKLAFEPYGWHCVAHAEIDRFAATLLRYRFPDTPNFGDVNGYRDWPDLDIDLVTGGTPCQAFSVAGLRQGLADPRGVLMLDYLAVARRYRPRWLVWENVAGALSHNAGRSFATFLRGLEECGYCCAWRVLDAQFVRTQRLPRAVPQRRRRLFVVGCLGNWRGPAEILLEPESMRGDSPPRRTPGQGASADFAQSLVASGRGVERPGEPRGQDPVVAARLVSFGEYERDGTASPVLERDYKYASDLVAHTLKADGFDASEDGTGRGQPLIPVVAPTLSGAANRTGGDRPPGTMGADMHDALIPIAFDSKSHGSGGEVSPTLRAMEFSGSHANAGGQIAVAFNARQDPVPGDVPGSLDEDGYSQAVAARWGVRRLTPRECERLQGLPDDWTDIPWRGAKHAPDGPRYRAIGNAWPLNVADWIASRITEWEVRHG
ncbi:DNA (cytosine-5-)-methyltransferase [Sinorhizobium meliloti]|uniref:DNA cytosine methyltransferase n=1 Tax=Rhizobium meliloti TaxID=382 RepID=UPI000FDB3479|nr:DNA (cytosine-5-)-methyltransferase [Sinorhizobium meliloti]RVH79918.1 DNA (cytosine-5-)-methyltransferase [Sinorhizobium meliloti]